MIPYSHTCRKTENVPEITAPAYPTRVLQEACNPNNNNKNGDNGQRRKSKNEDGPWRLQSVAFVTNILRLPIHSK
eukprot:scaffold6899_cov183-Amphora_coffeaeformis.AAC.1